MLSAISTKNPDKIVYKALPGPENSQLTLNENAYLLKNLSFTL